MTELAPVTNDETESDREPQEIWEPVDGMTWDEMNEELRRLFQRFFVIFVTVIALALFAITWMFLRNSRVSVLDGLLILFTPPILCFLLLLLENIQSFMASYKKKEVSRVKVAFVSVWLRLFGGKQIAYFHSRERLGELLARMPITRSLQDSLDFEDVTLSLIESNGSTIFVLKAVLSNQGSELLSCSDDLVRVNGWYRSEHLDGLQLLEEKLKPDKVTTSLPAGQKGVLEVSVGIPQPAVDDSNLSVAVLVTRDSADQGPDQCGWVQSPEQEHQVAPLPT